MSDNLRSLFADLPNYLSSHLKLTLLALGIGVCISVPLAIFIARRPKLRYPVMTLVGLVQTIPGLALLALMVPLLVFTNSFGTGAAAFGFLPALIALVLYSMLPVLRNTVAGIDGVDDASTEAAHAVGMTPRQVLWSVELPLAAPVILAGVRTAAIWTVGTATLATPIGQTCLGNYIFAGLQTRNWGMILFGVVCAGLLAVVLDTLLAWLETSVAIRKKRGMWLAAGGFVLLSVVGLSLPTLASTIFPKAKLAAAKEAQAKDSRQSDAPIRIGSKVFTEQYILAEVIAMRLAKEGIESERVESLGSTVGFDALATGDIDIYVDYSGTIRTNYMKKSDEAPAWRVSDEVEGWLAGDKGIRSLGSLGFENTYAFAMPKKAADAIGIKSLSDLSLHAPDLVAAGDSEFFARPEWQTIADTYGMSFKAKRTFDPSMMYEASRAGEVDVIVAYTSDGRLDAYDMLVLEDDRNAVPPYDTMLLLGPGITERRDVVKALSPLVNAIDVEVMRRANHRVDREQDKQSVKQAAKWLLSEL